MDLLQAVSKSRVYGRVVVLVEAAVFRSSPFQQLKLMADFPLQPAPFTL